MRRDRLLLDDIVAAADAVAEFIVGHSAETFMGDQSCVVRSCTN